ncbi:MAG TPA: ATP-binding cassette domain-containing protein, partial [Desulfobacterales bacterium]|nr:ATP-binding cassette domain-containing protein [Desulfobacterales bacterium]
TGSGKTTLINLVERFYDPEKGAIFFDRVDLKDWPIQRLRKNIGLVMQDVFIFAGSISENISLGRPEVGEQEIMNAVRMANLTPVIDRLPGGLNHIISQGGSSLSVGERQLLSFARALAGHPPLLVLDEATSSVDPHTEGLIQDAVSKISGNRTTLAVAHRLSTIRQAHKILVIHKGRIVEQGTHSELLKKQGIYYRLARLRRW